MTITNIRLRHSDRRKKILVVNCYFDETRQPVRRTTKLPKAMGPVYLAGAFSPQRCEVRLYNEQTSGPLQDEQLLSWPDMLVLTGLTTALDRMKHLTAYARTKNDKVVVAAGGPPIRALPRYSRPFFDYCCLGDIEQMREVIADAFGKDCAAEEMLPRFDLAHWIGRIAHIESSRYCNFRCPFCSLSGEGRGYLKYGLEYIRRQILAMGKKDFVAFIDNNFYGNDRSYFLARLELLRAMRKEGYFRAWGALVTNDFFFNDENLRRARDAGCVALFSGVESFDTEWLRNIKKVQNTHLPQVELIRKCLDTGIVFIYGVMFDVTTRKVADFRREIDFITTTSEITLPSYLSVAIPIIGTPFFRDCLAKGLLLPKIKLRDMDSTTLSLRPLDPMSEACEFVRDIQSLHGYAPRLIRHALGFYQRYRRVLTHEQMLIALAHTALLAAPGIATAPSWASILPRAKRPRTYLTTTEPLDALYKPAFRVAARYEDYFQPTMVTDEAGRLTEDLCADLLESEGTASRAKRTASR